MEEVRPPQLLSSSSRLAHYLNTTIEQGASNLDPNSPVVVMTHGFLFDPRHAVSERPEETDNAHGRVFHFGDGSEADEQRHHTSSWPLHLGFDLEDHIGQSGLAIAFGWHSQPGLASSILMQFQNFYARAYDYAIDTSWPFVNVLHHVSRHPKLASHPIDIVVHSLGSTLLVRALAKAAKVAAGEEPGVGQPVVDAMGAMLRRLGRVIILGGSEYVVEASLMYQRLSRLGLTGGAGPDFYNIASKENDVLDILAENFGPRTFGYSQVIGHNGLETEQTGIPGWMDLQVDSHSLQRWMEDNHAIPISGDRPDNVWDHWYYFTFRGNMRLYSHILRTGYPDREAWSHAALRGAQIPEGV